MTNSVEKTAKTVEDAINIALSELNASEEDVDIEIIDKGVKGIFGLIGSKQARVRVTIKESMADKAKEFLMEVFQKMDVDADVLTQEDKESVTIKITGDNIGILIGRRGETLDSLQYLTSLVVNKNKQNYKRVIIDIENYRQKREETLIKLANKLAERVVKYKKSITLEPMNPYERRIIHSSLQNHKYVETHSIGDEPNRKVMITLK
ncbi:RNA-binding cell elongation regulator Jag/EloR [Acetivibrio saccincola]|uniref:RNA-binding protein KhpB n=1 Tax=Acetivibrio saccincola TaxID=1677857 RepID=A0A2K9EG48_9FIRM|nr:RNA-binding cell elongation regulator Jag/EloR [Acetivibrio saccincola]AUG59114.1 R3H domain protein [Acetivibrio saccincola]PQQ65823.1 protein jag [Acetivibrio saccincola]HOA97660.1 RNA-binding cell elongation regulator Jag/EloR [Acetivibrio saccincola]HQD28935.1 RNA-binding cell elongation regulator Jag/EloR [Acetivibrio saccincola]